MTCPLFVELCAGTAAVSLRLHRARARPPVSRMGGKVGYSDVLLGLLGLRPGQGATDGTRYLWCEPDPGVRLLLEAYRDAALAKAAAEIIRGWAGEDPRALWERLRAEGPPRGPEPGEVARWAFVSGGSMMGDGSGIFAGNLIGWEGTNHGQGAKRPLVERLPDALGILPHLPADIATDARAVDPREVARWAVRAAWSYEQGNIKKGFVGPGDRRQDTTATATATAVAALPHLPAAIHPDAREVDPREVARWIFGTIASFSPYAPFDGFVHPEEGGRYGAARLDVARRAEALPTLPAAIHPDARALDPGVCLPAGTVAYMDPPYQGTTGYAADLSRAEVVALALRWQAAGAVVAVSEAVPVEELVALGWHAVDIGHTRRGQKRTFARVATEWVTMSTAPARFSALGKQEGLFGAR